LTLDRKTGILLVQVVIVTMGFTIGFELEYENVCFFEHNHIIYPLLSQFGDVKKDNSLQRGFELASNICRANEFKNGSLNRTWKKLFKRLKKLPIESCEHTGMHVHVGRKFLTIEQVSKVNEFVYSQYQLNRIVGEREPNKWCFFRKNDLQQLSGFQAYKFRYLNVKPFETIEFRFFKSPLTERRFFVNMQYVISIIEFVLGDALAEWEFRALCLLYPQVVAKNYLRFIKDKKAFGYLDIFLKKFIQDS
jgi:hypothetical protein